MYVLNKQGRPVDSLAAHWQLPAAYSVRLRDSPLIGCAFTNLRLSQSFYDIRRNFRMSQGMSLGLGEFGLCRNTSISRS